MFHVKQQKQKVMKTKIKEGDAADDLINGSWDDDYYFGDDDDFLD